jgi:hypothetical protein
LKKRNEEAEIKIKQQQSAQSFLQSQISELSTKRDTLYMSSSSPSHYDTLVQALPPPQEEGATILDERIKEGILRAKR